MKRQREAGFLISKIHQLSGRIFNRMLKEHEVEINRAQGRIMFVLWREDEIPIRELADRTSLKKTTLTSMLDRLERAGHVQRVPSVEDRRVVLIKRTPKDRDLEDRYVEVSEDMTRLFYEGFTEEEIDEFEGYLRRVFETLRRHVQL